MTIPFIPFCEKSLEQNKPVLAKQRPIGKQRLIGQITPKGEITPLLGAIKRSRKETVNEKRRVSKMRLSVFL